MLRTLVAIFWICRWGDCGNRFPPPLPDVSPAMLIKTLWPKKIPSMLGRSGACVFKELDMAACKIPVGKQLNNQVESV